MKSRPRRPKESPRKGKITEKLPIESRCPGSGNALTDALVLAAGIAALFVLLFAIATPNASADKKNKGALPGGSNATALGQKFKGNLPIKELTEDEAIVHALNRLAYGARPGDVERVRQMGLERWIDEQLNPDSIDDSPLNARLEKYPTLGMSSRQLLEKFPPPNQAAKQDGITKSSSGSNSRKSGGSRSGNWSIRAMKISTGPTNSSQEWKGRIGSSPSFRWPRSTAAIYSQRQLEAVWWISGSTISTCLPARARTVDAHFLRKRHDSPAHHGQVPGFARGYGEESGDAVFSWTTGRALTRSRFGSDSAKSASAGAVSGTLLWRPAAFAWRLSPSGRSVSRSAAGGNPAQQQERGMNENYGREMMELHTLGVDAGYTQQDVIEMAKCLTGWTIRAPRRDPEYVFNARVSRTSQKWCWATRLTTAA